MIDNIIQSVTEKISSLPYIEGIVLGGSRVISVVPEHQNKGIGSELISESLKLAKEIGFKSVIVLGHDKYYP